MKYDAAFQGTNGAFGQMAARKFLGDSVSLLPCKSFEEVFDAVEAHTVEYGVIPVENTLHGQVNQSFDLLDKHRVFIVGEVVCHIQLSLIAAVGVNLENVRKVYSHPVALAQCENYFRKHPHIAAIPEYNTAGAVEKVIRENSVDSAAVAGSWNAEIYGGAVLAEGIQDHPENHTRFLLLSRQASHYQYSPGCKTTILFKIVDKPGGLVAALTPFSERGINLAKIESRPIKGTPFKYLFYLDLVSPRGSEVAVRTAIRELAKVSDSLRVLGTYLTDMTLFGPNSTVSEMAAVDIFDSTARKKGALV